MKKVFGVVVALGIIAILFVIWTMVSSVTNTFTSVSTGTAQSVSLGWVSWLAGFSLWIGVILVALWMYLKHKKSVLTGVTGWAAILVLMFAVFGPDRTEQIATELAVTADRTADRVTNLVTNGTIALPPKPLSAEEQARRIAVAKQEAEVAAAQRVIEAAAAVEAENAAARAQEAAYLPADKRPCMRRNENELDCETVLFEAKTQYDRYSPPGYCIKEDGTGFTRTPLGEGTGWWRYRAEYPTVVLFFTAPASRCN